MSIAVRSTICLMLFFFVSFIIYKERNNINSIKKHIILACIIICLLFFVISSGNKSMIYDTPEELFNYSQKGNIEVIVYGDNSCMVYYKNLNGIYSYVFCEKSNEGYKLFDTSEHIKVFDNFDSDGSLEVFLLNDTDDYYLLATIDPETKEVKAFNKDNIEIQSQIMQIHETSFFVGYIDEFTNDSYILITQCDGSSLVKTK